MDCSRRGFFSQFGRSLLADVAESVTIVREKVTEQFSDRAPDASPTWLRPPGALPEDAFRSACTRCTDCQEACPYDSIRRLGLEFGVDAGTPAIIASESPCYLCEDMPCIAACEPRALLPIAPRRAAMGTAVIDLDACYLAHSQPCDYCIVRCPLGSDAISLGTGGLPVVSRSGCTGCGVCAYLCPASAIMIRPARFKPKGN